MKNFAKLSLSLLAAAAIAVPAAAQVDLSRYVSIGDSLTHGYMNGCVVKYGQADSYAAVVARSVGANFQQPLIDDPGLGGCQLLTSLAPTFSVKPSTGKRDREDSQPAAPEVVGLPCRRVRSSEAPV